MSVVFPPPNDTGVDRPSTKLIVPLVKAGNSPIAVGEPGDTEGTIRGALGERKVLTVRISHTHVALGEGEAIARTAAIEPLVRHPAHALGRDLARDRIGAVGARQIDIRAIADFRQAGINDRRIGKADGHTERRGPVFLEVGWLADLEESVVGLLPIQSVGLQPFFSSGNPVGPPGWPRFRTVPASCWPPHFVGGMSPRPMQIQGEFHQGMPPSPKKRRAQRLAGTIFPKRESPV